MSDPPTTKQMESGKLKVRHNGIKHGISARLLTDDEQPAFDAHLAHLRADLKPVGYLEHELVDALAYALWRRRKLYGWQEASTQAQAREALEHAAYPNTIETLTAEVHLLQGRTPINLPESLRALCDAIEAAGLFRPDEARVVDHLDTFRGAAEVLPQITQPGKSVADLRWQQAELLQCLDRVEGLLQEMQAVRAIPQESTLNLILRYEGSLNRSVQQHLDQLRAQQAHRLKAERLARKDPDPGEEDSED